MSVRIYVLSSTTFNNDQFLRFLRDEGLTWTRSATASPAEELVEVAGRICYLSFGEKQSPRSNQEYLRNLIEKGHESVLEHTSWTFLIAGVSRAFSHQMVRHRVGFSFSQLSQQYHDESEAHFVVPTLLIDNEEGLKVWTEAIDSAKHAYRSLLEAASHISKKLTGSGSKEVSRALRSAARSVLPNATETKIVVTANARALRHFLLLRGNLAGDLEMRQVCAELLRVVKEQAQGLFQDFETVIHSDGFPIVHTASPQLAQR